MRAKAAAAFLMALAWTSSADAQKSISVKIGVINDQSGLYSEHGGIGSVWAAKKAAEDFGAAAKGITVEIVGADHQNKPDIGATIARRWFDVDSVDAVADANSSAVALAINDIARDKNKVMLNGGAATSELTGPRCSPNTVQWTTDTWALANGAGKAVVKLGGDSWFILTADYAFGHAMERDLENVVTANGGKVLGKVRHPFPTADFSSFLVQAQGSKAKVIGLANAGGDTITSIKQAAEFGNIQGGQKIAALFMLLPDVRAIGLNDGQGIMFLDSWYWDQTPQNRAFADAFAAANGGKRPTSVHASVYSSVTHYLRAVEAVGGAQDGAKVVAKMKEMPTDDPLLGKGMIRPDGRKVHDLYLYEIKSPAESKDPYDLLKVRATVPAAEAFRAMAEGKCPLVANQKP
ncbi:ABC transporter substrate-binding protein [Enterovirga rhinocerotis]|uniref:Branched-chain amino acid transport system substrate-binding protein n=1 Tax=Enterovirga rhinocerotis TaxID=1339210 RepID=A0A4R7CCU7_9HYPH|nr:ABC transporter substrate-binding protein [Enterovirga rhinocerotis]TDR95006.1 branched-chain amino acid transport system substrate-binding protein [Enterovirga rhinocerotis]